MKTQELLQKLEAVGINLNLSGGDIKIVGGKERITPDIIELIRFKKKEIIELLKNREKIKCAEDKGYYYASKFQEGIFFQHCVNRSDTSYNLSFAVELNEFRDIYEIEGLINKLAKKHNILKCSFHYLASEVIFKINKELILKSCFDKVIEKPELNVDIWNQPFDLSLPPLVRFCVLKDKDRYQLVFNIHHIICDGLSIQILMDDIKKAMDKTLSLNHKYEYSDYVLWERAYDEIHGEELKDFWYKNICEIQPELLNLGNAKLKERNQFGAKPCGNYYFRLEGQEKDYLVSIGLSQKTTMHNVFLTLFNVLLYKQTLQNDIVIGIPSNVDKPKEFNDVVGMFVNTLPVRNILDTKKQIRDLFTQIGVSLYETLEKRNYSFNDIVKGLKNRLDKVNPLCEVMFVYNNYSHNNQNVSAGDLGLNEKHAKFDLTLFVVEKEKGFDCNFEFNSDVFSYKHIKLLSNCFVKLIDQLYHNPELNINEVDIIPSEMKDIYLDSFNETGYFYADNKNIDDLFREQVRKSQGDVAIRNGDTEVSYQDLDYQISLLARKLYKEGVLESEIVAVDLPNSIGLIISIFAIIRVGGVFMPIDHQSPYKRKQYLIKDSNAGFVLSSDLNTHNYCKENNIKCLKPKFVSDIEPEQIEVEFKKSDYCYLLYTSGTSGKPKGVLISQKNILNYYFWAIKKYLGAFSEVFPLFTSISFDLTLTSVFVPLLSGNIIHIFNSDNLLHLLQEVFSSVNVSIVKLTPSHLRVLINLDVSKSNVRKLIVGGEDFPKDLYLRVKSKFNHDVRIYNEYGPTEATIGCICFEDNEKFEDTSVPIGKPIFSTKVYLLDQQMKHVLPEIVGTIFVGGDCLSNGYLNNPVLTQEKFLFSELNGVGRLYNTGDKGVFDEKVNLVYKGRNDRQLKINGYRVELDEIEVAIKKLDAVKDVIVFKDENEDRECLIAFCITEVEIKNSEIIRLLQAFLPYYMIPQEIIQLSEFPINANGKLDILELLKKRSTEVESITIISGSDNVLKSIFAKTLNVELELVKEDSNFFQLGGNSLKIPILISSIKKELNIELSIVDFFNNQQLFQLAKLIDSKKEVKYQDIQNSERREYYETSHAQKRLWILDQLYDLGSAYVINKVFEIEGRLDEEAFIKAFDYLVKKHEIIRTNFFAINGIPYQRVNLENDPRYKLKIFEKQDSERISFENFMKENEVRSFDLSNDPLFQGQIIKLKQDKSIFILLFHHIIIDGLSVDILMREFIEAYTKISHSNDLIDSKLKIQYKDFALWHNKFVKSDKIEKSKLYWEGVLNEDFPVLKMPVDNFRSEIKSFEGDILTLDIEDEVVEQLSRFAQEKNVTMYMLFSVTLSLLLYDITDQESIVFGVPVSGREHVDLNNQVGFYVNTLPLKVKIIPVITLNKLIEEVRNALLQLYQNQMYPIDMLVQDLKIGRDTAHNPLFDLIMVMNEYDYDLNTLSLGKIDIKEIELKNKSSTFDFSFIFVKTNNKLTLNVRYNSSIFEKDTVMSFMNKISIILNNFSTNAELTISEIIENLNKNITINEFNSWQLEF